MVKKYKKLITIIIRGKNESRWLKILLKEIKKQTIRNYEIIFCDNNSDDNSKKQSQEPRRIITKKIGRNELCPCGSGKKYKQCHGN